MRRRAFTLLEMIVATTMVAILAGSLYASLWTAFKARRQAMGLCDDLRRAQAGLDFLQADLQSAVVPNGLLAGEFIGRSGDQNRSADEPVLSFHASTGEGRPGQGDIRRIDYTIENSLDGRDILLVRRVTGNLLSPQETEPPAEIVCRGLQLFALRYFDTSTWQEEWNSTDQENVLPKAVEVTLTLQAAPEAQPTPACRIILIPCGQGMADEPTAAGGTGTGSPSGGPPAGGGS